MGRHRPVISGHLRQFTNSEDVTAAEVLATRTVPAGHGAVGDVVYAVVAYTGDYNVVGIADDVNGRGSFSRRHRPGLQLWRETRSSKLGPGPRWPGTPSALGFGPGGRVPQWPVDPAGSGHPGRRSLEPSNDSVNTGAQSGLSPTSGGPLDLFRFCRGLPVRCLPWRVGYLGPSADRRCLGFVSGRLRRNFALHESAGRFLHPIIGLVAVLLDLPCLQESPSLAGMDVRGVLVGFWPSPAWSVRPAPWKRGLFLAVWRDLQDGIVRKRGVHNGCHLIGLQS